MSALGSKADIGLPPIDVRFTPKSGHWQARLECPLSAISGHRSNLTVALFRGHGPARSRQVCSAVAGSPVAHLFASVDARHSYARAGPICGARTGLAMP